MSGDRRSRGETRDGVHYARGVLHAQHAMKITPYETGINILEVTSRAGGSVKSEETRSIATSPRTTTSLHSAFIHLYTINP